MTTLPATVQLSNLTKEIGAHIEALAPPSIENIATGLNYLLSGGMALPGTIKPADMIEVYAKTLLEVPACGFRTVLSKLRHGHYDNINLAFIPLPNELAAMSRAEAKGKREDLIRLRDKQRTLEELQSLPAPVTSDVKQRIRNMVAQFKAEVEAQKASAIPQEPITEEKAEYYRQIMSLRDASDLSAEQMAYRRKIIKDVDSAAADERRAAE